MIFKGWRLEPPFFLLTCNTGRWICDLWSMWVGCDSLPHFPHLLIRWNERMNGQNGDLLDGSPWNLNVFWQSSSSLWNNAVKNSCASSCFTKLECLITSTKSDLINLLFRNVPETSLMKQRIWPNFNQEQLSQSHQAAGWVVELWENVMDDRILRKQLNDDRHET